MDDKELMEKAKKIAKRSPSNTMDAILLHNIRKAVKTGKIEGFVRDYLDKI